MEFVSSLSGMKVINPLSVENHDKTSQCYVPVCVMSSSNFRSSTTSSFSIRSCGRKIKSTRSKGVLPCQAMPHTSSGSVKVEQKWKQPQYLALNYVLSPFHTQGDSQHRNIVDLHMGDVTGRE